MAETSPPKRKISSATLALVAAALFAAAAVAIALFRSAETTETTGGNAAATQQQQQQAGNVADMVASLRERLRQDPDNHEGWHLLGLSYREMGRFAEAEQAFRRAMELSPRNADYVAYLAEALVLRGGGEGPPPEAEHLFRRALELQPGNPQARYYLATLKDFRGDHRGAVEDLIALLRDAPADAPWEPQVRGAAETIARQNNIDIAGRLPERRQSAPSTATAAIPGPTREQMEAAKGIPPSQQDAMVEGMVSRLEGRLRQNPRDADRWIMLMRSRKVLNQDDAARAALRSALAAFQGDAATQQRLRAAAQELGIPAG